MLNVDADINVSESCVQKVSKLTKLEAEASPNPQNRVMNHRNVGKNEQSQNNLERMNGSK